MVRQPGANIAGQPTAADNLPSASSSPRNHCTYLYFSPVKNTSFLNISRYQDAYVISRSRHKGTLTMCVVYLNFFVLLSGNLALCGAISNLRADEWRSKSKLKKKKKIFVTGKVHVPPIGDFILEVEWKCRLIACFSGKVFSCATGWLIRFSNVG